MLPVRAYIVLIVFIVLRHEQLESTFFEQKGTVPNGGNGYKGVRYGRTVCGSLNRNTINAD